MNVMVSYIQYYQMYEVRRYSKCLKNLLPIVITTGA
jgi:hypothetical protein